MLLRGTFDQKRLCLLLFIRMDDIIDEQLVSNYEEGHSLDRNIIFDEMQ